VVSNTVQLLLNTKYEIFSVNKWVTVIITDFTLLNHIDFQKFFDYNLYVVLNY